MAGVTLPGTVTDGKRIEIWQNCWHSIVHHLIIIASITGVTL
jgi:hypothetical protein